MREGCTGTFCPKVRRRRFAQEFFAACLGAGGLKQGFSGAFLGAGGFLRVSLFRKYVREGWREISRSFFGVLRTAEAAHAPADGGEFLPGSGFRIRCSGGL